MTDVSSAAHVGGRTPGDRKIASKSPPVGDPPVRVVCNPTSGGGAWTPEDLLGEMDGLGPDLVVTEAPGDAREAARDWGGGLLAVAGGDGTVNEVVSGLGQAGFPRNVVLAIVPAGTGNDLAATLKMPLDPAEAIEAIRAGRVRTLDVARVRSEGGGEKFFVNVAAGGVGAKVSEAAADKTFKARWGRLSYLRASLELARTLDAHETRLTVDGTERKVRAANVAVGNCRYAGGGWPAAPKANPEDGFLDLVVIEEAGLPELLSLAPKALAHVDYLGSRGVFFARGREIKIETDPPGRLEFNVDGELIGRGPAEFSVVPRALKVIVGPGYSPEPERWPGESRYAKSRFKVWSTSLVSSLRR